MAWPLVNKFAPWKLAAPESQGSCIYKPRQRNLQAWTPPGEPLTGSAGVSASGAVVPRGREGGTGKKVAGEGHLLPASQPASQAYAGQLRAAQPTKHTLRSCPGAQPCLPHSRRSAGCFFDSS